VVEHIEREHGFSERRALRATGFPRSTQRYRARRVEDPLVVERLTALAHQRPRFGYERLHILLRREGFIVNHKRVRRLYKLAGLKLRAKRGKRRLGERRGLPLAPVALNDRWSMDFVSDRLADGRAFRALAIVDDYAKRCNAIEVDTSLPGLRVIRALEAAIERYGKPKRIVMDNGPEFTCRAFLAWVLRRDIEPCWIEPGKPIQNAYIESFNARFRDECLDQHFFESLRDARALIADWRDDYNRLRPHTSLGGRSPNEFISSLAGGMPPARELHAPEPAPTTKN
jgi:putative transposase